MDFVVQSANVQIRAIRTPTHSGNGAAKLERRNSLLARFVTALPNLHRTVVTACGQQLGPSAARHSSVQGVDDSAMCTDFSRSLTGGNIRVDHGMVRRDGVEEGREQGPLEVGDGGFME